MNEKLIDKWEVTGLLTGIDSDIEKWAVANMLDDVANYMLSHKNELKKAHLINLLPMTRRIYDGSGNHYVDIPSMISCLDYYYEIVNPDDFCMSIDMEVEIIDNATKLYLQYA